MGLVQLLSTPSFAPTDLPRNMFLAAAPYFQARFASNDWLLAHFQPSILTVATVTNLGFMIVLTKMQRGASYPKRIVAALVINIITFTLLAISTTSFRGVSAEVYFVFVLTMVLFSSMAAGLFQNGLFAFVSGFGQPDYVQGIMTGQGVAGVLPPIVQIVSVLLVLSVPERKEEQADTGESYKSAFAYFLTATGVSLLATLAFWYLARTNPDQGVAKKIVDGVDEAEELENRERKEVGMMHLFFKLKWFALGVFVCFAVTMLFPVYTQAIVSVRDPATAPRLFKPACFIPMAFLFWNFGDLLGRMMPSFQIFSATHAPKPIFWGSVARLIWIPLYLLCNINGKGAVVNSDTFYLVAVQLLFGMTSGYIGSTCMMAAPEWVEENEREAAGGFMGLMLVSGLGVGSLLSFGAAGV